MITDKASTVPNVPRGPTSGSPLLWRDWRRENISALRMLIVDRSEGSVAIRRYMTSAYQFFSATCKLNLLNISQISCHIASSVLSSKHHTWAKFRINSLITYNLKLSITKWMQGNFAMKMLKIKTKSLHIDSFSLLVCEAGGWQQAYSLYHHNFHYSLSYCSYETTVTNNITYPQARKERLHFLLTRTKSNPPRIWFHCSL